MHADDYKKFRCSLSSSGLVGVLIGNEIEADCFRTALLGQNTQVAVAVVTGSFSH